MVVLLCTICTHRMLDEHFMDQMDELIRLCPRGRQTMLFSATMTDEVCFATTVGQVEGLNRRMLHIIRQSLVSLYV